MKEDIKTVQNIPVDDEIWRGPSFFCWISACFCCFLQLLHVIMLGTHILDSIFVLLNNCIHFFLLQCYWVYGLYFFVLGVHMDRNKGFSMV